MYLFNICIIMIQLSDFMDATPHGTFISMINDTKTQVLFYLS